MTKISGVYLIQNKTDGKKYVGVSVDIKKRWSQHKGCYAQSKRISHIANAIKLYGVDNFSFVILEECDKNFFEEKERKWIKELDTVVNGYNLTHGGSIRKELSEETRKKMSISQSGLKKSEIHKEKIHKKLRTDEIRQKISLSLTGRKLSNETKKKMSESKKGRKRPAVSEETRKKRRELSIAYWERVRLQLIPKPKVGRPPKVKDEPNQPQSRDPSSD